MIQNAIWDDLLKNIVCEYFFKKLSVKTATEFGYSSKLEM